MTPLDASILYYPARDEVIVPVSIDERIVLVVLDGREARGDVEAGLSLGHLAAWVVANEERRLERELADGSTLYHREGEFVGDRGLVDELL